MDDTKLRYNIYYIQSYMGECKQRIYVEKLGCSEDGVCVSLYAKNLFNILSFTRFSDTTNVSMKADNKI